MTLKKKILIIGGSGFIGSELAKALIKKGSSVIIASRDASKKIPGTKQISVDVTEKNFSLPEADIVVHLAAYAALPMTESQKEQSHAVNIEGIQNVLTNLHPQTMRFIYASSAAVYGNQKKMPIQETATPKPLNDYGKNKLSAESIVRRICMRKRIMCSIVRIFNVYGTTQERGLLPDLLRKIKKQNVVEYRNPESTRDFIYIDDCVSAIMKIMEKGSEETYNIGTGKETSVKKMITTLKKTVKKNIIFTTIRETAISPYEIKRSCADISRLKKLGWKQKVSVEQGIRAICRNAKI